VNISYKTNLISYWKNALLENNFDRLLNHQNFWWIGRDFEQIENDPTSLILNDKSLNKIVSDYGEEETIDDEQVISLKLFIAAIHLRNKDIKSVTGKVYFVIPYTAVFSKLTEESYEFKKLIFPEHSKFNKDCLEPWGKFDSYIIGDNDQDEEFLSNNPDLSRNYEGLILNSGKHFEHVVGASFKDFINPNLRKNNYLNFFLTVEEHKDNIYKHLHSTYEMINSDHKPNLIDLITNPDESTPNTPLSLDQTDYLNHSGQMDKSDKNNRIVFPIDPSQRKAIMSVLKMPTNSIQAINGPPGTGKTTMLQSIIASMWINFAIEEKEPPIIVATAATNQAVTNVISSFEKIPDLSKTISLYSRWIPNISSYGWFLPSRTASERPEFSGFQKIVLNRKWTFMGKASQLFELDINDLESKYMQNFHESFKTTDVKTIKQAKSFLHNKLKENENIVTKLVAGYFELKAILRRFSGAFLAKKAHNIQSDIDTLRNTKREMLDKHNELSGKVKLLTISISKIQESIEQWIAFQNKIALSKNEKWLIINLALNIIKNKWLDKTDSKVVFIPFRSLFKGKMAILEAINSQIQELKKEKNSKEASIQDLKKDILDLNFEQDNKDITQKIRELKEIKEFIAIYQRFCDQLSSINSLFRFKNQQRHYRIIENILTSTAKTDEIWVDGKLEQTFFEYLDLTFKATNFHVASRYWEACFVLKMKDQRLTQKNLSPIMMASYLGCCFVATLYTLPQMFLHKEGAKNKADLLIVDEAGQATPETGASLFYWAKKAVVVGDTKQIKPVSNMNESDDDYLCSKHNLYEQKNRLDYFGYLSSSGSLMSLAQTCSKYKDKVTPKGITLHYHYRCLPTIINFCNELLYNGELIPIRKEESRFFLPPVCYSYHNVPSTKTGTSWKNDTEANLIAEWLYQNSSKIVNHYNFPESKLDECIAIITPYKPQAYAIRKALEKKFYNQPSFLKVIQTSLVIGTAHSLQGAEKPIVIFSNAFFSKDKKDSFLDREPNILNVIISRAKDSLVLFGHKELFTEDGQSSLATKQLANYMAKHGSRLFPRNLVIVESPEKALTIEKYLKGKAIVIATKGHFVELNKVEIEDGKINPIWEPTSEGLSFISNITEELKHCDSIYIATDSDREGEAIGWHVYQLFKKELVHKKVNRMTFFNIEENEIVTAFDNPSEMLNINMVKSAITRQILDYLIGKEESRFLNQVITNKSIKNLSIGRIQAACLDAVNEYGNNKEIYSGSIKTETSQGKKALFLKPNNKYNPTAIFKDKSELLKIKKELNSLKKDNVKAIRKDILVKGNISGCSDTMEIIIQAYKNHQLMPWETVEVLQSLYESGT